MFKIIKHLFILSLVVVTMSSCSEFRYVSKKWDTRVVLDSNSSNKPSSNRRVLEKNDKGVFEEKTFNSNNQLIESRNYLDTNNWSVVGVVKFWYDDGKVKIIENYNQNGQLDGDIITYYQTGQVKRKDLFRNGKLVSGECFTEDGRITPHTPYYTDPVINISKLSEHYVYPENLRINEIEEKVILKLLISKYNKIRIYVYDSDNSYEFVQEAINAIIKYGDIKAALRDGEPYASWVQMPVVFKLR